MQPSEPIRHVLEMTEWLTTNMGESLRDHPLTPNTRGGKGGNGNHAIWTLGHLAVIEGNVPNIILGEPNPLEKYWPIFGMGTDCKLDATDYPTLDELLQHYRQHRAATLKLLDKLGDAALDNKPLNIPAGFENPMRTVGHTFTTIAAHNMMHCGQLADIRRVVGLKRFF